MKRLTIIPNLDKVIIDYRFENEIQEITEYIDPLCPEQIFWIKNKQIVIGYDIDKEKLTISQEFFNKISRSQYNDSIFLNRKYEKAKLIFNNKI